MQPSIGFAPCARKTKRTVSWRLSVTGISTGSNFYNYLVVSIFHAAVPFKGLIRHTVTLVSIGHGLFIVNIYSKTLESQRYGRS
jgi:hypothetical protein